ncbi:LOW QUALITY PROTEIN: Dicer-like protein 2 [Podospora pseudoanserina]|uniref:Dicer-like protein 2 n=1 Tax=Podospora pseudoanserina TaxID=2609844 RepID=A0ABR0IEB5_9PEZI|nr:LOW QUALITY PROTEIN: Dicer-like protein 2 [Podospora pseudoanserina]
MGKIQACIAVWASTHQYYHPLTLVRPAVAYPHSSLFRPNLFRRCFGRWGRKGHRNFFFALKGYQSFLLPPLCSEDHSRYKSFFCLRSTPAMESKDTRNMMADEPKASSSDEDGLQGVEEALQAEALAENIYQLSSDTEDTSGTETPPKVKTSPEVIMTARAYQVEMFQESLQRNIIVAMDTGSGKTQVAILRIQEELGRSPKLIWFLAPTVQLAAQQFEVIEKQIPGVQSRFICGADNVQAWKYKTGVWQAVLTNVRIVVSTYQILFDAAVAHAFVPLESISLLVIDEAHNCVGMNPVARLMRESYAKLKQEGKPVPHILGLTASPLMRSNLAGIETLEQTLDAICRTPCRHRDELMAQVNRPEMKAFIYGDLPEPQNAILSSSNMTRLIDTLRQMDITADPHIIRLREENTERSREALKSAIMSRNTQSQKQMKALFARAREMRMNLGPWAAEYYINRVVTEFLKVGSPPAPSVNNLWDEEKAYLSATLQGIKPEAPPSLPDNLSRKVQALLQILASHKGNPVGIVFVTERATASVLSHVLSVHPVLESRYSVESMVGTSKLPGGKHGFLDLTTKEDIESLHRFRKGKVNLLVATSVLEEGIDVPVCNLVICFDKPSNLKSFIQRRGRARMNESELWVLFKDDQDQSLEEWKELEQEMKRKYEDELREIAGLEQMEQSEADDYPKMTDPTTGAQMTIHDAKQHLDHFCSTLSTRKFVNWAPFYIIHDLEGNPIDARKPGLRAATVNLPVSLSPSLRRAESLRAWPSEAFACKDAAFQAYKKLYEAGLIDKNMLPARTTPGLVEVGKTEGITTVEVQYNPWLEVSKAWESSTKLYSRRVTISSEDGTHWAQLDLSLPIPVPLIRDQVIHSERKTSWTISMGTAHERKYDKDNRDHTYGLLAMAYGHRFPIEKKQYPIRLFSPEDEITIDRMAALEFNRDSLANCSQSYLIRDVDSANHPYFFREWLPKKPPMNMIKSVFKGFEEAPEDVPYVSVQAFPKRAGQFRKLPDAFIHQLPSGKPYPRVILASQVKVDKIPTVFAHVGLMLPALTAAVGDYLVARDLLDGSLQTTGITDLDLVVTAITASGARRSIDYERIEFLGDSILKFCTTINCSAQYLHFPEGFLSATKDKIVSNYRLCKAAIDFGLARYIINTAYTTDKWRPVFVEDYLERTDNPSSDGPKTREMPTKTLADVVEALIGASHISGGINKALACISLFLPEAKWQSIDHGRQVLYDEAPDDEPLPPNMHLLEKLIGYTFKKKSLLIEAMTHPSFNVQDTRASLDRLEFLGDAILDYLVVESLFSLREPLTGLPLENSKLHLLRTALVNADILGFLVMEWAIEEERYNAEVILPDPTSNPYLSPSRRTSSSSTNPPEINLISTTAKFPLWSFLRYTSPEMGEHILSTQSRHSFLRDEIRHALDRGKKYPWSALTRLQAQKFYGDVFESLMGAVWVDSGDLEECRGLMERIGIMGVMERLVREGVHCLHPKEELGLLAAGRAVEYRVEENEEGQWECAVVWAETGRRWLGLGEGEEARVRGADAAVGVLKAEKEVREQEKRRVMLENLGKDVVVDA